MRSQGGCATHPRGGWKLGWWELTERALQFGGPGGKTVVNAQLGRILGVEVSRRKFLVTSKPVLIIRYASAVSSNAHVCWLITADVEQWRAELAAAVPQHRFAADVPIEVHVDSDEVTVVAELHTGARSSPPDVRVDADHRRLVLTSAAGAERFVALPVEVDHVVDVTVSSTATMVVRLHRVGSRREVIGVV
ncbi:MAG: hypothetical protein ACOYEV_14805 [Candidatus Nanopelagicales bacterium]